MSAYRFPLLLLFAPALLFGGGQQTTTALTSSPNPSVKAQGVTLTATITTEADFGNPDGDFEFFDGATSLGTSGFLSGGGMSGTVTVSFATAGVHQLTAVFMNDDNYSGSTSPVYSQIVNPTTTTVSSPSSTVIFGQPVTLTATISPPGATGKVTFYDGTNVLGSKAIAGSSGTASIAAILPAGVRSITAYYLGDSNGSPSTSAALSETVSAVEGTGFATPVSWATGNTPSGIAEGDFNGDGIVDFAVVNQDDGTFSVFLSGAAGGGYHSGVTYSAGGYPTSIAVGDFNGDGSLDIAINDQDNPSFSILLGNGDGTFTLSGSYSVVGTPTSIAVADFNGDGFADLAITDGFDQYIRVLLGVGDGSFQPGVSVIYGNSNSYAKSAAVGDFNGDGFADIAVGDYGMNGVGVLFGNGDGTFQPSVNYGTDYGPAAVVVGNFNGDAFPDIAVANSSDASVSVLLNSGSGTFPTNVDYNVGNSPEALATGDFNGDGFQDLAVGTGAVVEVFLGDSSGGFSNEVTYGTDSSFGLVVGDFNGDGVADIASTDSATGDTVQIFLGTPGAGTFLTSSANPSSVGQSVTFTATVTPSSATGTVTYYDGATALIPASTVTNGVATYTTSTLSMGSHSIKAVYSGDTNDVTTTSPTVVQVVNTQTTTMTSLTTSGSPTMVGTAVTFTATVSPSTATGTVTFMDGAVALSMPVTLSAGVGSYTTSALSPGVHPVTAVYSGDSGDAGSTSSAVLQSIAPTSMTITSAASPVEFGHAVLLTATLTPSSATGKVTFYNGTTLLGIGTLNSGAASLSTELLPSGTESLRAYYSGDSNNASSASGSLSQAISPVTANGLEAAVTYATGTNPSNTVVGDFNADGIEDIAVANTSGTVTVLLGASDGTFAPATGSPFTVGTGPTFVTTGDFNGDGNTDLVVVNSGSNNLGVLLGVGDGTFHAQTTFLTGANPECVAVGDFNGDGIADLAVANQNDNTVSVLLGVGDGTFLAQRTFATGSQPISVALGDFNTDGITDLAVATFHDSHVSVLLGVGDGTFSAQTTLSVGGRPNSVTVADLNHDGKSDLLVANNSDDTISVMLGHGDGTFAMQATYATGASPVSLAVADFDGDGNLDAAVSSRIDGAVSLLLGSGTGTFGARTTYPTNGEFGLAVGDFNRDGRADLAISDSGTGLDILFAATATTTTLSSSSNPSSYGSSVTLTATLAPLTATGTVTFYDGSTALTPAATISNGVATYSSLALSVGSHPITAVYSGDSMDAGSTAGTLTQVVNQASTTPTLTSSLNPSTYGTSVTLTVSVSPSTATGPVAFKDGSGTIATGTLSGGTASTMISTLTAGSHSLTVVYGGDTDDAGSTSTAVIQAVNQATTTTSVISSANPSTYEHTVTLTATVSPSTATGTVAFAEGPTTYCAASTVSGGVAICALPQGLSVGSHNIIASYGGDTNYSSSAASAMDQVVNAATAVTMTSSASPSIYGESVTLTATVPVPTATGKVTFYNGTAILGIATVTAEHAALQTTLLPAGALSLKAYYSGDINNGVGTSAGVSQTVTALDGNGFVEPAAQYTAGDFPAGAVVGDFNGDGYADVAVANQNSSNVSVFLGTGTGTFGAAVNYTVGALPVMVATGDFNGDGIPDLVTANSNGNGVSILLGNANGTFQTALNQTTSSSPNSIAVADFNGDGVADIAVTLAGTSAMNVLLGNGDGTFQTALSYATGSSPKSVVAGDFNEDGFADLAVLSTSTDSIYVFRGAGDGTFGTATTFSSGAGPSLLAVGNFNSDAIADLVVANSSGVSVFLGNGDATFQTPMTYTTSSDPQALAVGDFNGDGKTDVVLGNPFLNNVMVLLGDGLGSFSSRSTYAVGASNGIAVGDFNGDGRADIVAADFTNNALDILLATPVKDALSNVLTTSANPTAYGASLTLTATLGSTSATGSVRFMDGSTLLGMVTPTLGVATYMTSSLSLTSHSLTAVYSGDLYNAGSTSNTITEAVAQDTPATVLMSSLNPSAYGQSVTFTATVQSSTATGSITFMDGTTSLGVVTLTAQSATLATSTLSTGSHSITAVYGGDTDDAGSTSTAVSQSVGMSANTTVLTSSFSPSVYGHSVTLTATVSSLATGKVTFYDGPTVLGTSVLVNGIATFMTAILPSGPQSLRALYEGDTNFAALSSAALPQVVNAATANALLPATTAAAGTNPFTTVMADFNGDQIPDLVATNLSQSTVTVLLGVGDGTFQAPVNFPLTNNGMGLAVGDFNGDGKTDIAAANSDGVVSVLLGDGNGSFGTAVNYTVGVGPQTVAVTDFNGDGFADLAVTTSNGLVNILLGRGDGTFQPKVAYAAGVTPDGIAVGYFDANLSADLVVTNPENNTVSVLLGNGDGTFQSPVTYATGDLPADVVVGDFNGDGHADLAVSNLEGNSISILSGIGDGTFSAQTPYVTGNGPAFLAMGDFDGDGHQDLAVGNESDATLLVLHGLGDGTFQQGATYMVGTTPAGVVAADFNGDGRTDLAVASLSGISILLGTTQTATTTTLTSSLSTSIYGQSVTLTATLAPLSATGTVTFMDGSTALGTVTVVSGVSALVSTTLPVGVNSITAVYSGDSNDVGSTSAAFSQTVNQDTTTTTLSSSANPSSYGQSVTITATLSPLTASGTVMFQDGSTLLGSVAIAGGAASIVLPSLAIGPHSLTASYGGDTNDMSSASALYLQTVAGIPTTTTVVPSENPATYGEAVTLTATVLPATVTGTVTFRDGSATLYTSALINGVAAVAAQSLASGSHAITATYNGSATDAVSTGAVTLQVQSCGAVAQSALFADSNGGSQPLTVTSSALSCNWTASSSAPWIELSETTGVGSAVVTVTLTPNATGNLRTGTILIGGATVAVTQRVTAQVFADVPPSVYYFDEANLLYAKQVTSGCSTNPLDYCPNANILRWEMAVFIVRSVFGGDNFVTSQEPYFNDVPAGSPGFNWIQKMYELGITSGCGNGDFCPTASVPRDQMAIFVIRMRYGSSALFDYPTTPYFTDVTAGTFGFEWIQRLREDNITGGCNPTMFCPTDLVTRGEMSVFIMLGGFNVMLPAGTPVISSISPATITHGLSSTYTITGLNTNFVQGTTSLEPIPGITIGAIAVSSPTVLTVTLTAASDAPLQPESVLAVTGSEEAVLPNALVIQ